MPPAQPWMPFFAEKQLIGETSMDPSTLHDHHCAVHTEAPDKRRHRFFPLGAVAKYDARRPSFCSSPLDQSRAVDINIRSELFGERGIVRPTPTAATR